MTGRMASKKVSSEFVYRARVEKPPPVDSLQSAPDSHCAMPERLSYAIIQELFAAISKSRSSRGGVLTGAVDGSTILRRIFSRLLFADPCSPWRIKIGYGPVGRQATTSHVKQSTQF